MAQNVTAKKAKRLSDQNNGQSVTEKRPSDDRLPSTILLEMIDAVNLMPEDLVLEDIQAAFDDALYEKRYEIAQELANEKAEDEIRFEESMDEYISYFEKERLIEKYTYEIMSRFRSGYDKAGINEDKIKYELLKSFVKNFPQELRSWIFAPLDDPDSYDAYQEAFDRYYDLFEWHSVLRSIAKWLNGLDLEENDSYPRFSRNSTITFNSRLQISTDYRVKVGFNEIFEHFNGLDARRLKTCPNCQRIFWAKRADMTGCSTPCAKVLRTRKWREKTTEEQRTQYKINRIEKEIKKERMKKDGSL